MAFAAEAAQVAGATGDSAVQLLAGTAVAAVKAVTDPTQYNNETFVGLARERANGLSYHSHISFHDEPDVAALAAQLAYLPGSDDRPDTVRQRRPSPGPGSPAPVGPVPSSPFDLSVASASPQAAKATWFHAA